MCFSASASFIASGFLTGIGLLACASVRRSTWFALALIPLFFAIQQFAEGLVWLWGSAAAASLFLFFAYIVWPLYIPLSCFMIEPDHERKRSLYALTVIGCGVSMSLFLGLVTSEISFYMQDCHIVYDATQGLLRYDLVWVVLTGGYCLATIAPFFISTVAGMQLMGFLVAGSCLMAYLFYTLYFVSVWCFFAALISSAVLAIVRINR